MTTFWEAFANKTLRGLLFFRVILQLLLQKRKELDMLINIMTLGVCVYLIYWLGKRDSEKES